MTAFKTVSIFCLIALMLGCETQPKVKKTKQGKETVQATNQLLDRWHKAAAEADYDVYFNQMTNSAVFIGTDASENWTKQAFQEYAKPHFDKGKAWTFKVLERNVYQGESVIWFDELLDTQMGLCRGSGVLRLEDDQWKIAHYVLSVTVPNEEIKGVVTLKQTSDSLLKAKIPKRVKN